MRILFLALFFVCYGQNCFSQKIVSGIYSSGLNVAFDELTGRVTGFYDSESGYDEKTGTTQFSCTFYFSGKAELNQSNIISFYPGDSVPDSIPGILELGNNDQLTIRLNSDHGGCWNVQTFASEPVSFSLYKAVSWNQIRYVTGSNVDLFKDESGSSSFNVKLPFGSVLGISEIKGDLAQCTVLNSTDDVISGWIKLSDLNLLK
jgi:hypothetical protein